MCGSLATFGGELSGEPRVADAGVAREQDDLAGAAPGLAQAAAQQGALRRSAGEVGVPAARRLEPAFDYGDVLDHEGFDRLGEALHRLPAEAGGGRRDPQPRRTLAGSGGTRANRATAR